MSYQFLGLGSDLTGEGVPECDDDPGSGGFDQCIGYEFSCPNGDECCSTVDWYNRVYAGLKGGPSLQWKNEEKIAAAAALLLAPTGGSSTGMEQYAWDHELTLSPKLLAEVTAAVARFNVLLPMTRWERIEQGAASECQSDGYYSVRRERHEWPLQRFVALTLATGVTFTPAQQEAVRQAGISAAPQREKLEAWFAEARKIIAAVPGGRPNEWVFVQPRIQDLLVGVPPDVMPTPWLETFYRFFNATALELGAGKLRPRPLPVPTREPLPVRPGTHQPTAATAAGGTSPALIVAGALAFGAGAYFLLRS